MTRPSPSPVTDDGLVELVARAICRAHMLDEGYSQESADRAADGDMWKNFRVEARAALAASDRDVLVEIAAKAMQQARDEIGATEQQRIAFAYAEAAMRSALSVPLAGEL